MNDKRPTPTEKEYKRLLLHRGLTEEEADAWTFLINAPDPTSPPVLDIPFEYRNTGLAPGVAAAWFLVGIEAEHASAHAQRGWTPAALIRLRRAIWDTHDGPKSSSDFPLTRQPGEHQWMSTNIPPDLAPLYVATGYGRGDAIALERRRALGDTTIKPALITLAALRRNPHI